MCAHTRPGCAPARRGRAGVLAKADPLDRGARLFAGRAGSRWRSRCSPGPRCWSRITARTRVLPMPPVPRTWPTGAASPAPGWPIAVLPVRILRLPVGRVPGQLGAARLVRLHGRRGPSAGLRLGPSARLLAAAAGAQPRSRTCACSRWHHAARAAGGLLGSSVAADGWRRRWASPAQRAADRRLRAGRQPVLRLFLVDA